AECLARLHAERQRVKFLCTVPSFHNPAGITLSARRRPEVLGIWQRAGVLIIEDNPYGLLGFDAEPRRALRADNDHGVVYLGSFSKTVAAGGGGGGGPAAPRGPPQQGLARGGGGGVHRRAAPAHFGGKPRPPPA